MTTFEEPEETIEKDITLTIPLEAYRKIMAYADACDEEISGFADVEYKKDKQEIVVGEVYLLEQNVTGTNTHLEEEAVSKFNIDMIKKGRKQLPQLWWHSHVNMGTFFSGTDEETCSELQNDSFNIALVVNKAHQYKAMMYVYSEIIIKEFGEKITSKEWRKIDPLPVHIQMEYAEIPKTIITEVKEKVKSTKFEFFKVGKGKKRSSFWDTEDENGDKYGHLTKVLWLPKDRQEAIIKIKNLKLEKAWDYTAQAFVYFDSTNGYTYVDYWDVLSDKRLAKDLPLGGKDE
jgi:proteasome lid subunit RPN8/RPN11